MTETLYAHAQYKSGVCAIFLLSQNKQSKIENSTAQHKSKKNCNVSLTNESFFDQQCLDLVLQRKKTKILLVVRVTMVTPNLTNG